MREARSLSSGASGSAPKTALRPATDLGVKSSMESCSCSSATALRDLSLKPSTRLLRPSRRWSSVSRLRAGFSVCTFSTSLSVFGIEHLREVEDAGVVSGAPQASGEVHQATGVARDQGVSPTLVQRFNLLIRHRRRDIRHLHREGPPEPATQLLVLPIQEAESLDMGKQLTRLLQHAELAPLVATAVEDSLPFESRPKVLDTHHVGQEVRELPHASCEDLGTLALFR